MYCNVKQFNFTEMSLDLSDKAVESAKSVVRRLRELFLSDCQLLEQLNEVMFNRLFLHVVENLLPIHGRLQKKRKTKLKGNRCIYILCYFLTVKVLEMLHKVEEERSLTANRTGRQRKWNERGFPTVNYHGGKNGDKENEVKT